MRIQFFFEFYCNNIYLLGYMFIVKIGLPLGNHSKDGTNKVFT